MSFAATTDRNTNNGVDAIVPIQTDSLDEINGPGGLFSSTGIPVQATNQSNPMKIKEHHPAHVKKFIGPSVSLSGGNAPVTIWTAYSFNKLGCTQTTTTDWTDPKLCGHGQTVAIVDAYDDPNVASDLSTFDTQFGLPACTAANGCFVKSTPQGLPATDSGWALEISLDVQWAHAIAPGAKIVLVESSNNSLGSLLSAVDSAVGTGAQQVSNSWGGSEFSTESNYDFHYNSATASFFVSSGDGGHGVMWPAASPYVISVGGTTLVNDSSGNWVSEKAWSGSGGGISLYEPKPSYQNNFNTNTKRTVPDVSYDADPNTGVYVYDSVPLNGQSGWWLVGGTSAGAPQWASISAIANSQNAKLASASFGTSNALYGAATGAQSSPQTNPYLKNYHDIISGNNGPCGSICNTRAGYDEVTGVGSPQSNNLIYYITPTHNVSIKLNPISSVPWGKKITVSGLMVDNLGHAVTGALISFNGTGASSLANVITDVNGSFTTTGTAPVTVQAGWKVQAHFAGNSTLNLAYSNIVTYSTTSHHTSLSLTQPPNVRWGQPTSFVATLTDTDSAGSPISGNSIHFNGTGVIGVADAITDSNGVATGVGTSPVTVKVGWKVEAMFSPIGTLYVGSHSSILKYNTLKHPTSLTIIIKPNPVHSNAGYAISGILKDLTTSTGLGNSTIQFVTNNSAIVIPSTLTNSTGGYIVAGLVAPNLPGNSVQIRAQYNAQPLYFASTIPKLLKIT